MRHDATRWDVMRHDATDDAALPVTRHDVTQQDATPHNAMRWDAMQRNATDNAAILFNRTSLPVVFTIKARRKRWNQTAYLKIKAKRTTPQTVAKGDWLCRADGKARRSSNAIKMAKMRRVKPAVDQITKAVSF